MASQLKRAQTYLLGKGKEVTQDDLRSAVSKIDFSESEKAEWLKKINGAKKAEWPEISNQLSKIEDKEVSSGEIMPASSSVVEPKMTQTVSSLVPPPRPATTTTITSSSQIIRDLGFDVDSNGAVMKRVDIKDFKRQVVGVISKINKTEIQRKLLSLSSTQDQWSVITVFMKEDESLSLIAMCAASLVLGPEDRSFIMDQLGTIAILQGRSGRVQRSLTNLAGFIGLACAKDNTSVQRLTRFVPNPLLGEPPRELQVRRLDPKVGKAEGEELLVRQKTQYQQYVDIHRQTMALHSKHFAELPLETKARVRVEVESWFLGT